MSCIDALLARRSVAAQYLVNPGPSQAQIDAAIDVALRAPDHGRLQPWRFRLVRGPARARLAEKLVEATLRREPAAPGGQLEKIRRRAEAPLVVVASAALKIDPKVPELEQILAAGSGVMNLLNGFHVQGFGAIWLTGPNVYDPAVAAGLGLDSSEKLLGLVHVGTPAANTPAILTRPARGLFVSEWLG
jgi:nitroreductase